MTDKHVRAVTAASVLLVAAIAALVSYIHIDHLAVINGRTRLAAALLPLSIDGTVVASSMTMLRAARTGLPTPRLARTGLVLSVGATLAANVDYGAAHGLTGALMSGWPGAAFILCAEMGIGMVRHAQPADCLQGTVSPAVPTDAKTRRPWRWPRLSGPQTRCRTTSCRKGSA